MLVEYIKLEIRSPQFSQSLMCEFSGISISSLVNQAMMTKTDKINALKETEEAGKL
jgi:hypothetical protein